MRLLSVQFSCAYQRKQQQTAERNDHDTSNDKFPGTFEAHSPHDLQAVSRKNEIDKTFNHPRIPQHRQNRGNAVPHIVKGDNERPEREIDPRIDETAGRPFLAQAK